MAEKLGNVGTTNMIALGLMSAITGLVELESLAGMVNRRYSGKVAELNVKALHTGAGLIGK